MARAKTCTQCNAPLPDLSAGSVNCQFCGALNSARSRLWQRADGAAPNTGIIVAAAAGLVMLVGIGVALALLTGSEASEPDLFSSPAPIHAPVPAPPALPQPPPAPPPPVAWGQLQAVAVDERGDLLALLGDTLVKVDRKTFTPKWSTSFSSEWRFAGNYRIIVPRGEYVAVISDRLSGFFEAATGAKVNDFKYRRGGILQRVCAAGSTQVLVDVLGEDLQRFDAATGLRASTGPNCQLREKLGCPSTQRCGWQSFSNDTYSCRYTVSVGADVFRHCTTEDGQQRAVIVAQGASTWEVPSIAGVDTYFGVVDETLIVAGYKSIVALNPATGDERWRLHNDATSAVFADGTTLFLGKEGTLVAVNARSGEELQRLPLRTVRASAE